MLKTTRQGTALAMGMQPIGGAPVGVVGGVIFRDGRNTWRLVGAMVLAGNVGDVLAYLFGRAK